MSDPHPLIEHVGEMLLEREIFTSRVEEDLKKKVHLKRRGKDILLLNLMRSLYAEAEVVLQDQPHHNKMFNFYSHKQDDLCKRQRDTTPIHIASKLYLFEFLKEHLPNSNILLPVRDDETCHIIIRDINVLIAENVLSLCHSISKHQPITDLWIRRLTCESSLDLEVFKMSKRARSISILKSTLSYNLLEASVTQLPQCQELTKLHLKRIRFYKWTKQYQKTKKHRETMSIFGSQDISSQPKWHNICGSSGNQFDIMGINIAHGIRKWGHSPLLQQLRLEECAMAEEVYGEILKSLSRCHHLTHLDLGRNTLGQVGNCLAELIKNLGTKPSLKQLYLKNCSMPEEVCQKILQSLSACKHLSHLDLSGNTVGNAGKYIVEIICNLGADPPLQLLCLENSQIPTEVCNEILKALSICRNLAHLNLSGLSIVKTKQNLIALIRNLGSDSQLQRLYLQNCALPQDVCDELLKALPVCKHLTHLKLGGNYVMKTGKHLTEIIDRGTLGHLYLTLCRIPPTICKSLLASLSRCDCLFNLSLAGNCLTGVLSSFHADPESASPYLRKLHLESTELNKDDINHIRRLIETHRLPELGGPDSPDGLWLQGNNLAKIQKELEFLLEASIKECNRELRIGLWNNNISLEFQTKWQKRCEGTNVILLLEQPLDSP